MTAHAQFLEPQSNDATMEAYDALIAGQGPNILVFSMEGCAACEGLWTDLRTLQSQLPVEVLLLITLGENTPAASRLTAHFQIREFPTAFVVEQGNPTGGWVGYDMSKQVAARSTELSALVTRLAGNPS